ncbi:MAG: hypothetical protein ACRDSZ_02125 [Pseudonocardiaceae bacterium]
MSSGTEEQTGIPGRESELPGVGLAPESHVTVLDALAANAMDWLAGRVFRWLVTPSESVTNRHHARGTGRR